MKTVVLRALALTLTSFFAAASPASAVVTYNIQEGPAGVTGSYSGTLNVGAGNLLADGIVSDLLFIRASEARIDALGGLAEATVDAYSAAGPTDLGAGIGFASFFGVNGTGDPLFISESSVMVPNGYAGGFISGTFNLPGQTLDLLGLGFGIGVHTYDLLAPNEVDAVDEVVLTISRVPLPATLPLTLAAIAIGGFAARRRADLLKSNVSYGPILPDCRARRSRHENHNSIVSAV